MTKKDDKESIKLFNPEEDALNYTIVGDKKMGKTTLLKSIIGRIKKLDFALIAYDREGQFQDVLPCYDTISDVPGNGSVRQFAVIQDSVENVVALAEMYRLQEKTAGENEGNKHRRLIVIVDELDTFYGQHGPLSDDSATKKTLTEWIDYGRHRRVEMWGCVRRPQKVWQHYFEQSNRIFLFKTSGDLARKKLLDVIGSKNMIDTVRRLPPYEFIIYPDEMQRYDGPTTHSRIDPNQTED